MHHPLRIAHYDMIDTGKHKKKSILEKVAYPEDIKQLTLTELETLGEEIRNEII